MKRIVPWIVLGLSLLTVPAFGAVPQTLSYQGVLNDGSGNIVPDGNYRITFRIYDDPILGGPHLLWTEAHDGITAPVVPVSKGGFSVTLGATVPVTVQFNTPMWLELQVAPDPTPVAPRTELTPAPYALNARNVFDGGSNNFVGIGRSTPVSPNEYFGVLAPVATGYGGMYILTQGAASQPFYGYYTGVGYAWTYLDGSDGDKWKVNTLGTDRLAVTTAGNVGIGTNNPSTTLEVAGGTKLGGASAPAIKMLKLTGTTAVAQGGNVTIPSGIAAGKILGAQVLVEYTSTGFVPPRYTANPGYEFNWYAFGSDVTVWNTASNSANILSKPIKILLTYEE